MLEVRYLTDTFAVAGQLSVADIEFAAAQGFRTLVNNRPDGEGGEEQPNSEVLAQVAAGVGLHYVYLPVDRSLITQEHGRSLQRALEQSPSPVLAFCRTGARSARLFELARQEA